MSFILCVCGNNFSILKSDGKEVRKTGNKYIPVKNDFKKVFRINNSICAGFSGTSKAVKYIVSNLYKLEKCSIIECKNEILCMAKTLPLNEFGLNFIITGIENSVCKTYTFKSINNFKEDVSILNEPGVIMTCYAPPIDVDSIIIKNIVNKHIDSQISFIQSLKQIKDYMNKCIVEVSTISETVNDNIYGEEIHG